MDKYITMSKKETKKYDIINKTIDREIKVSQATNLLSLSTRQVSRLKARFKEFGARGLTYKSRGNPSNRKIPDSEKEKIIEILHKKYPDFGPTFASEKLEEVHQIKRDPRCVQRESLR